MSASGLSEVPHGTHWPVGEGGEGQNRPVMSASGLSEVPHGTHWPVGEGEGQNRPVMSASGLSEVPHGTHWPVGEGGGSEQTSDVCLRLVRGTAWHPLACGRGGRVRTDQ